MTLQWIAKELKMEARRVNDAPGSAANPLFRVTDAS